MCDPIPDESDVSKLDHEVLVACVGVVMFCMPFDPMKAIKHFNQSYETV